MDNNSMANPNTKAELGAEAGEKVEAPRTPRRPIAEGLRKIMRELGSWMGLDLLRRSGTPKGQEGSLRFAEFNAAHNASVVKGTDSPDVTRKLQQGTESALKGEDLPQAT